MQRWLLRSVIGVSMGVAIGMAALPVVAEGLAELELAARGNASAVRIAHEEAQLLQHRLDAAEAQRGARLSAGVGLASTREPVTQTLSRDYRRGTAQVGVRWPLLEGAQALERAQTDARGALEAARPRARQAEIDVLRELRGAYVDHLRSTERLALAEGLLRLEASAAPMLAQRSRQSFLLEADRRELQTIFEIARRDAARARAQRDDAQRRARRLSALPQATLSAEPPRWGLSCVSSAPRLASAAARPAVALAASALATRESLARQQQWNGIDAGVSLTHSQTHDIGALSGRSTGVSIDVSVPFSWRALRDARLAEVESAVRRARLELDSAREADAATVDQALRELEVREADRIAAVQRLEAAREALRVAELRGHKLDGDVLEKMLRARHGVYATAVDTSDAMQRLERAQIEVLAFAEPCGAAGAALEPPQWQALPAALGLPLASARTTLGWFAWQAGPWLAAPADTLAQLPAETHRVLLGFDAVQLRTLATPAGAEALRRLMSRARERGVRIELLLGEPDWVMPAGRERALALLRPIAELPFDGLNLDLERSQLAPGDRRRWADGLVATMAAVHALVRWPIALTAHDRDLLDPAFNRRLQAAGVTELVAMIYVADRERAAERARAVLRAAAGLRVSVAQSVERELAATSSLHQRGRAATLALVAELARGLADPADGESQFGGMVIQSFEEFRSAQP